MKRIALLLCINMFMISSPTLAGEIKYLRFTVTNLSNSRIYFKSTDLFDFGKRVAKNETKTITYDFPPKIITIKILIKC